MWASRVPSNCVLNGIRVVLHTAIAGRRAVGCLFTSSVTTDSYRYFIQWYRVMGITAGQRLLQVYLLLLVTSCDCPLLLLLRNNGFITTGYCVVMDLLLAGTS